MVMATMGLQSCLHDDTDLFSESAAERLEAAVTETTELLESSASGWALQYYSGESYEGGGYTFLLRFQDGKAYASGEIASHDSVSSSSYDIIKDQGPVLTFDTYNEIMHYFAEPASDGTYDGDYEFVIMGREDNLITLKGKKTGNYMRLIRLAEGTEWEEYLDSISQFEQETVRRFSLVDDGAAIGELTLNMSTRRGTLTAPDGTTTSVPFCVNTNGITFAQAFRGEATDFVINTDSRDMTCVNEGSEGYTLSSIFAPDYVVSLLGSTIAISDEAANNSLTVYSATEFTYSTTASWMTISASGNTLTLTTTANTTGSPRIEDIIITNDNGQDTLTVVQADFQTDIVGSYTFQYTDYENELVEFSATISGTEQNVTMQFSYYGYSLSMDLLYDEASATFTWYSGQNMGPVTFSDGTTYYIFNIYESATYWSYIYDTFTMTATLGYEDGVGTVADFVGYLLEEEISYVYLMCCSSTTNNYDNWVGYMDLLQSPRLIKTGSINRTNSQDPELSYIMRDPMPYMVKQTPKLKLCR